MTKHLLAAILPCMIFLAACSGDEKKDSTKTTPEVKDSVKEEVKKPELAFDTLYTDFSKFIAGQPTLKYLKEVQAKDYYAEHFKFTDTSWTRTVDSMLNPI